MMTRRGLLGALGLAGVRPPGREPVQVVVWEQEDCLGCGRAVAFLPGQRRNRCGWCGHRVRHA